MEPMKVLASLVAVVPSPVCQLVSSASGDTVPAPAGAGADVDAVVLETRTRLRSWRVEHGKECGERARGREALLGGGRGGWNCDTD